ncbi:hypothetical protein KC19_10G069300 [Ceratodon purpureus]|uniref:Tyrosine-specific transport protein n=1 Tax=Ceratodon purpureus TaxID=3225 RepID=A0A8T0GHN5_CERPU|nr:hypothetical protein KC19_10G069300 [Ceratodon purpureus]
MPLCFGKSMAIHGESLLSRSLCRPGANSYQLRLKSSKDDLWLGLRHPGVQPAQTWGAVTTLHFEGGRLSQQTLHCRAKTEQRDQSGAAPRDDADGISKPLGSSLARDLTILDGNALSEMGPELVDADANASAATGSIFGAVALITGSSVGAGILALPAITAPTGFLPSATLMCISWAFLLLEALLLAEVNVELMRRREPEEELHSQVLSLRTMADETMGPLGGLFTTVIYLMLSYTLLVAYISKSGEVLSLLLDVPNRAADLIFTFGLGGLMSVGGAKMADSVNQVLTIMLTGLFLLIVFGGASMADWTGLEHADWTVAPKTLPIILLALVYHDLTPVVCAQLGGDIGRIRISILLGSLVPLAMFLSWDAVALCINPLSGAKDPIDVFMRIGGPGPAFIVESFALLAVATSFIGTVLGLSEFLLEQLGKAQGLMLKNLSIDRQAPQPLFEWLSSNGPRVLSFLFVLAPPLAASSLVSDAFFSASDLAGAYGMTSLYGVIPPIMAWSLQDSSNSNTGAETTVETQKSGQSMPIPGGRIALATVGACAVAVIVVQVVDDFPQFSSSPGTSTVVVAKVEERNLNPTSTIVNPQFTTLIAP